MFKIARLSYHSCSFTNPRLLYVIEHRDGIHFNDIINFCIFVLMSSQITVHVGFPLRLVNYRSVPGKRPPPGAKRPGTSFQGVNVATYGSMEVIPWVSAHVGQNCDLCLSAHGHLPGTLRYNNTHVQCLLLLYRMQAIT